MKELAAALCAHRLDRPFGVVRRWGLGLVRPNDQQWPVVSVHQEGERLDLGLECEGSGIPAGPLSIWSPDGLEEGPAGAVLALRTAARIRWEGDEAWRSQD